MTFVSLVDLILSYPDGQLVNWEFLAVFFVITNTAVMVTSYDITRLKYMSIYITYGDLLISCYFAVYIMASVYFQMDLTGSDHICQM